MRKHLCHTLLLCLMMCSAIVATAQTKHYELNIGVFNELTVADGINVDYVANTDSAGYAIFDCVPNLTHAITFTNKNGKVKIELISDEPLTGPLPTITVYSATLDKATNLGDSTLTLQKTTPGVKLSLKVMGNGHLKAYDVYTTKLSASVETGNGHIFVNGKAQEANYNVAGAGVIEAGALQAVKAKIWMLGIGSVDCTASEILSVYGAGSGTVYYQGSPDIKKRNVGVKMVKIN